MECLSADELRLLEEAEAAFSAATTNPNAPTSSLDIAGSSSFSTHQCTTDNSIHSSAMAATKYGNGPIRNGNVAGPIAKSFVAAAAAASSSYVHSATNSSSSSSSSYSRSKPYSPPPSANQPIPNRYPNSRNSIAASYGVQKTNSANNNNENALVVVEPSNNPPVSASASSTYCNEIAMAARPSHNANTNNLNTHYGPLATSPMPFPTVPSLDTMHQMRSFAKNLLSAEDYQKIGSRSFIKKQGWRKLAFGFQVSFEIVRSEIVRDEVSQQVVRAEFVVRATLPSMRSVEGWGACDRGEKKFTKPNHDIPATAETRAKTRATQDLIGFGDFEF